MANAEQIVEAEIGPQDDIGQFVRDALPLDFLVRRFALETTSPADPFVYDTETEKILCYMNSFWTPEGLEWSVNLSKTSDMMQRVTGVRPPISQDDINTNHKTTFKDWRKAIVLYLSRPWAMEFLRGHMGITEATGNHVRALGYESKLEAVAQYLSQYGFLTEKIGLREKGEYACYVIGEYEEAIADRVIEALTASAARAGLLADSAKAARRNERLWQIDFNVPNLFEDIGEFVDTAFRSEVPGHAELERLAAYRDALRGVGLPVYKVTADPFSAHHHGTWQAAYIAYFDNRTLGLSKGKTAALAQAAADKIGMEITFTGSSGGVGGHGETRAVWCHVKSIAPMSQKIMTVESEDYDAFGEVAAAKNGTIGDELRLKRLVSGLKELGFQVRHAAMRQHSTPIAAMLNYLLVEYRIQGLYHTALSLDDTAARDQIQKQVADLMNQDNAISGAMPVPVSTVNVSGSHKQPSQFTVEVSVPSLRRKGDKPFEPMDTSTLKLESSEDAYGAYGDEAIAHTPGLRTRVWMKKLKASLGAKGFDVKTLHAAQWPYSLKLVAHVRAYNAEGAKFEESDVSKAWYDSVKDTGNRVIVDGGQETRVHRDAVTNTQFFIVYSWVGDIEPHSSWPEHSKISENILSVDDMDIAEHERLNAIARIAEAYHTREYTRNQPVHVLWLKAVPVPKEGAYRSLPYDDGTVYITCRTVAKSSTDAISAFVHGLTGSGSKLHRYQDGQPTKATMGMVRSQIIPGGYVAVDTYAFVEPLGPKLAQPLSIRGPSSDKWLDLQNVDESSIPPDDEIWVRDVVGRTPGYKDLERLKSAMRAIEEVGLEVIGATQYPKQPNRETRNDTTCEVLIATRRHPGDQGQGGVITDMRKIASALEAHWNILDITWDRDTLEHNARTWLFKWNSHDAPQDIVPLHLQKGSWAEYLGTLAHLEMDSFLVEQFDEPAEESDPYLDVFSGAQEVADPLWRERLRLNSMAEDIKKAGYYGRLLLLTFDRFLDAPKLCFALSHPDRHMMSEYYLKHLLKVLNDKYQFASPGNVWARGQDFARSHNNAEGKPEARCEIPYMYLNNERKKGPLPMGAPDLKVVIPEGLEFTPTELAGFGRVASKPDRKTAANLAFKAMLGAINKRWPDTQGYANMAHIPRPGGDTKFELYARFDVGDEDKQRILTGSIDYRIGVENYIRDAILAGSPLKRYHPKRTIYYKWPKVEVIAESRGQGDFTIAMVCTFTLKNLNLPDRHVHVANIRDTSQIGESDEYAGFDDVAVDPLKDRMRLIALIKDLQKMDVVGNCSYYVQPTSSAGKQAHLVINAAAIPMEGHDAIDIARMNLSRVSKQMQLLLKHHSFGEYSLVQWRPKGAQKTLVVHVSSSKNTLGAETQTWGWQFEITPINMLVPGSHPNFALQYVPEGMEPGDIEGFVGQVLKQTDPGVEDRNRLSELSKSIAALPEVYSGVLMTNPATRYGWQKRGNGFWGSPIDMQIVAQPGVNIQLTMGMMQSRIADLLKQHGYGDVMAGDIGAVEMHWVQGQRYGWRLSTPPMPLSVKKVPAMKVTFGDVGEALDINPDDLVKSTFDETDPAHTLVGIFQGVAKHLITSHWDWVQDGAIRLGPGQSGQLIAQVHILAQDGVQKPAQFVQDVVKHAILQQGQKVYSIRVVPTATIGWMCNIVVPADAHFIVHRFPSVVIDFPTQQVKEDLQEALDPNEFMQGADRDSKYGQIASLKGIAASLAADGWLGYLRARSWQGSGTLHEMNIYIAKRSGAQAGNKHAEPTVKQQVEKALKGCPMFHDEGVYVHFVQGRRIPGYSHFDYPGFWHWTCNVVVDLNGRQPGEGDGDGSVMTLMDIPTGNFSVGVPGSTATGRVNPPGH